MELTISLPELRYQYFKFRCLFSVCFSPESFFWLASHTRNHLLGASLNPALVSATCVVQLHYVEVIWSLKSMFTYCVNASAFTTRPVCVYISKQGVYTASDYCNNQLRLPLFCSYFWIHGK
jgi:hypothetical protein